MPRFTQLGASGEGSALINGGTPQSVTQIDIKNVTITTPRVKETYATIPKFLQFAGQIMLGNPDAVDPTIIGSYPVQWFPHQQYNLFTTQFVTGVFWKLPVGVSVDLTVSW